MTLELPLSEKLKQKHSTGSVMWPLFLNLCITDIIKATAKHNNVR